MIIRQWTALAKEEMEGEYLQHFREDVMPNLRKLDGFLGATVLRATRPDGIQLTVQTRWTTLDAVRAFAAPSLEQAVVAPEVRDHFRRYDKTVFHLQEVFEERR
jgi:heme-degrading monooxygenase HmoA